MPGDDQPQTLFDVLEGFYIAHILGFLHEEDLLGELSTGTTTAELASRKGLDATTLEALLLYLCARSDLLAHDGHGFRLSDKYADLPRTQFLIDQYLGAYGSNAQRLDRVTREPAQAAVWVDRHKHAQAFARLDRPGFRILPEIIRQLGITRLLDLGSGTGALLCAAAQDNPRFHGWGLELNEAMCREAKKRIGERGLGNRVDIVQGDSRRIGESIPEAVRKELQAICAASLANEYSGKSGDELVGWLQELKQLFPGRLLLVADYYSRLGQRSADLPRHGLLHDLVQVISGQGVPPPDLNAWQALYRAAGAEFLDAYEEKGGVCWFIHLLKL